MQIIVRARQAGKTTALIKIAAEKQLYIVCPNRQEVQFIAELANKLYVKIAFPLTWQEFLEKRYYGTHIKGFVIDNLDLCLQQSTSLPIEAVTLTK